MRFLRSKIQPIAALKIILAPALAPLIQLVAGVGAAVSLSLIALGFVTGSPKDYNRTRYIRGTVQVDVLAKVLERYRADCGTYPSARQGFNALIIDQRVAGWHGPYLRELPLDPWYRPYIYLRSENSEKPEILSYGADRKPGGELFDADISSRNPARSIPDSPYEIHARFILNGIRIGSWIGLVGSFLALKSALRPHKA